MKKWKIFAFALAVQFAFAYTNVNPFDFWVSKACRSNLLSPSPLCQTIPFNKKTAFDQNFQNIRSLLRKVPNDWKLEENTDHVRAARAAVDLEKIRAYAVVDFDTGEVLADKSLNTPLPVASLTKLMTAVVALDLTSVEEEFTVTDNASQISPTKIGVIAGQKMEVRELITALLLTSANDAAEVLKEGIDQKYKGEIFIRAMNEKAKILGLKNTSFDNPQGFDGRDNFSTAADLAVLSHYAISHYPLIRKTVKDDYEFLPLDGRHKQFDLYNWNGLLGVYPGTYGVKIGYTPDAGYTTITVAQRENQNILAIVLGAQGTSERDRSAAQLLDSGFAAYNIKPANIKPQNLKAKYATWKFFK